MQGPTDSSRVGVEGTTGEIRCEASDMDNGHDNTGGSNGDETTDAANIGTNTGGSNSITVNADSNGLDTRGCQS